MKTLKEKIAVMQAALDGKEIEWISRNDSASKWTLYPSSDPDNWGTFDYRIKEEPMEFWVNVCEHKNSDLFETEESAKSSTCNKPTKTIKVREVTE